MIILCGSQHASSRKTLVVVNIDASGGIGWQLNDNYYAHTQTPARPSSRQALVILLCGG